ncbi:MAG TPA: protein kinase, partial [Ktedonobacterales bacterium]|nr:protein kinase [Ktedonobacterales bacterium]
MAGNMVAGPDTPLSGLQLAQRYALSEEMASGALCRIIRGDDLTLRRPVVVKAIPPAQVEVYTTALRATSAQTHPAAVALYDAIQQDGWLFLVQEAVAGQALSRYLRQGVPSERATNLALQLARALAYTHHREMVHGDLTPSAVLVDRQATVRINNFGLPPDLDYFLAEGGAEIQALIAEGTPYSDVLALGLLLRQLLSTADLAGTEHGARQLRDDVPPDLARLVARCTTRSVDDAITD